MALSGVHRLQRNTKPGYTGSLDKGLNSMRSATSSLVDEADKEIAQIKNPALRAVGHFGEVIGEFNPLMAPMTGYRVYRAGKKIINKLRGK